MGEHQRHTLRGTQRYRDPYDQNPVISRRLDQMRHTSSKRMSGGKAGEQKPKDIPVHMHAMSHNDETRAV